MVVSTPKPAVKMDRRHRYEPVGTCIYCGPDAKTPLAIEHIIPEGMGGTLELQEASCKDCEKEIHAYEGRVMGRMFGFARPQLGIRGKKRGKNKKQPSHTILEDSQGAVEEVQLSTIPAHLIMPQLPPAGALIGNNDHFPLGQRITATLVGTSEQTQRLNEIGENGRLRLFPKPVELDDFYRMLAKIAHSYTVAERGFGRFYPWTSHLILKRDFILPNNGRFTIPPIYYVGGNSFEAFIGDVGAIEPTGRDLHEITIEERIGWPNGRGSLPMRLIVVRIHLFAKFGAPVYYVVSGTPRE